MTVTAVGAILIGWLPGALIFRLPWLERERRAVLPLEERAFWALILSLAWSLIVVLALAFAGQYRFERLLLANALVSGLVLAVFRTRLAYQDRATGVSGQSVLPVVLAALGLWLFYPPAEYVIGGKDPGVYINQGIQIAQRGSLVSHDAVVSGVPTEFRDLFFPSHNRQTYYGSRFMGFFIQDPATGTVIGQFPHLFPASIAIGYGLNGLTGARQAVAIWAVLGLIAVYFVGARLIGPLLSAAAVALLAINVIEVWWGRYPNAEVVMQALLFAAILAFARALDGGYRFFGPVAGTLLGLQLFLRYDAVLAIASFAAAGSLAPFIRRPIGWGFGLTLVTSSALGLWYLVGPMRAYSEGLLFYTRDRGGWWLLLTGAGVALGCRVLSRSNAWSERVRQTIPLTLMALVAILAVYAYFFRWPGGRTAAHDAAALRTFAWYVTPWGLAAALAGLVLLLRRSFWRDPAFFLTLITYCVFFFYKIRIVPEHFWSTRRFLAVTLPGLMLGLGGLAAILLNLRLPGDEPGSAALQPPARPRWASATRLLGAITVCVLFASLWISFWRSSAPVRPHVEYAGLVPRLEALAAHVGENDLVIVESRNASDMHALALPLAYIYARNVLVLNTPRPPKRSFEAFVSWAQSKYSNVFFLGGGGTDLLTRHLSAEPVVSDRFQIPEYASPKETYPTGVIRKEFDYGLYKLSLAPRSSAGPISQSIGLLDDLYVFRFHAKERRDDGVVYRWTTSQSYVVLPTLSTNAREVTVWMSSGGRPASAPPPTVTIAFDDHPLGTATPRDVVEPYTFMLPAALVAASARADEPSRLQVRVATWNPHTALGVNDTRNLGVLVTKVEVR